MGSGTPGGQCLYQCQFCQEEGRREKTYQWSSWGVQASAAADVAAAAVELTTELAMALVELGVAVVPDEEAVGVAVAEAVTVTVKRPGQPSPGTAMSWA